jgi:hypothetical protein
MQRFTNKMLLLLFLLFYAAFAFAQKDNPDSLPAKVYELTVKTIPPNGLKLPFESINVIDSRSDTSKLGFIMSGRRLITGISMFQKVTLKPGIATGIEQFYNEYYKDNFSKNAKTLLISIRKLWIDNMPDRHGKFQKNDIERSSQQNIYAKFEYYSGSENEYTPLKRIDTVFQLTTYIKVEDYDASNEKKLPFLCFALEKMIENINYEQFIKNIANEKKMIIEDIKKYNDNSKNIAILNETIKKGVFKTFDEFKNNQPSIINFSKRKIPNKKIYEIIDEENSVIVNYFAYYDGEKFAKSKSLSSLSANRTSQDNFGIYRIGNSFQFFENLVLNTDFSVNISYKNTIVPLKVPVNNLNAVPRQIDLETGEVY